MAFGVGFALCTGELWGFLIDFHPFLKFQAKNNPFLLPLSHKKQNRYPINQNNMMNGYLEIILRCIAVYLFMVVALRIFGKKELSQLNTADVILVLLISNAVQNAMVGKNDGLDGGIVAALTLFTMNFIFKKIMLHSPIIKNWVQDKPEILIRNGKPMFDSLAKIGITSDELEEAMREHGVEHYKDVKLAMLEMDGNISIISGDDSLRETQHKRKIHKTLGGVNP
jgi:uncharacterized membrane protein YcaP (DUF421 family)